MSLPASQQRALDTIDSDLRTADTLLASMFRVFTELTRLEKMPRLETFPPVSRWTRAGRQAARRQRGCALPGCRRPGHRASWPWPRTGGNRVGALVLVPLLLAATLSLLLLTVLTTSPVRSGRCAQTTLFAAPVRLADTGCTPGSASHAGPAGG
jgi:hypothetical protein